MTRKKQMPVTVSALADRTLRFIGSDETPDRTGDIVMVEGWDVSNYLKNPVVLFNHDASKPIGKAVAVRINRRDKRLEFDVRFPEVGELASEGVEPSEHALFIDTVYNLYKGNYLSAVSVGFKGDKAEPIEGARGMRFEKQELLELSLVSVPANPNALATAKSMGLHTEVIPMIQTEKSGARLSKTSRERLEKLASELRAFLDEDAPDEEEEGCGKEKEGGIEEGGEGGIEKPAAEKCLILADSSAENNLR